MIDNPHPFERLVQDYKLSDQNAIAKVHDQVDWDLQKCP